MLGNCKFQDKLLHLPFSSQASLKREEQDKRFDGSFGYLTDERIEAAAMIFAFVPVIVALSICAEYDSCTTSRLFQY